MKKNWLQLFFKGVCWLVIEYIEFKIMPMLNKGIQPMFKPPGGKMVQQLVKK
jgi:hypothetical protein